MEVIRMKKTVTFVALATLFVLVLSTAAFAQSAGFGGGQYGTCLRDTLSPEQQTEFDQAIETYRTKMFELREEMHKLRESGDNEAFREAQAKRFEIMEEKRAALSEILPEEFAERFQNKGQGKRNFGVEKERGGFGMRGGCGR